MSITEAYELKLTLHPYKPERIGVFASSLSAVKHIEALGYTIVDLQDDKDNPGCSDVAASRGPMDLELFTIEPVKY